MLRELLLWLAGLSAAALLAAAPAGATRPLALGFSSDPALSLIRVPARIPWIGRAVGDGAGIVRVNLDWAQVAPARPRGFNAGDPGSHGYNWAATDSSVRELSARGLRVLLTVFDAPAWAQGRHRPANATPGTWRPDPRALAAFATAAARRYDGAYPLSAPLPRVGLWQAWNEPNLGYYLSPQWTRSHGRFQPASPGIYRQLLNAFYGGVKSVSGSNLVVTGGTAPYGDGPGGARMQPVAFDRSLFCLRGSALRPTSCPDPPHLDVLSHHPYATGGPLQHAFNADDAAVPDVRKLARVLHAAERYGHVLPRTRKRLWVTEISWDSSPPDPHGVPIARQARWLEQSLYVLWRQGVDTVLWLQIVDSPPIPDYADSYQAGVYFLSRAPKPAAVAYRFPFVVQRLGHARVLAWGRAPAPGQLSIQVLDHGRWRTLRRLGVQAGEVFAPTLKLRGRATLRAQLGSQTSLTWGA